MKHRARLFGVALVIGVVGTSVAGWYVVSNSLLPGSSCRREIVSLGASDAGPASAAGQPLRHVIVVAMENTSAKELNNGPAPFLQSLASRGAHTSDFRDPLWTGVPSEPHYVWMEAGTNLFDDAKFCDSHAPSAGNSTSSTEHLVTQMEAASPAISWMSYQEGLDPTTTGACPIYAAGKYAPKHDPFVFFQDVVGNPPSATSPRCVAHHRPASALGNDLASVDLAEYVFVTPDLCHDMHDRCGSDRISDGDRWLQTNLPPLLDFADANESVVFLVWDESSGTDPVLPFYAFGPSVKRGYTGAITYTHSSLLRSIETMFGLPPLPTVEKANDLSDLFEGNVLPLRIR